MVTDTIADALTRIRNSQKAGHKIVRLSASKVVMSILEILKKEGFIQAYAEKKDETTSFNVIEVQLKYYSTGQPVIGQARRISSPGRRVYMQVDKLPKIHNGLGISIVSTSQGVISDREARKLGIGGELVATIA